MTQSELMQTQLNLIQPKLIWQHFNLATARRVCSHILTGTWVPDQPPPTGMIFRLHVAVRATASALKVSSSTTR